MKRSKIGLEPVKNLSYDLKVVEYHSMNAFWASNDSKYSLKILKTLKIKNSRRWEFSQMDLAPSGGEQKTFQIDFFSGVVKFVS